MFFKKPKRGASKLVFKNMIEPKSGINFVLKLGNFKNLLLKIDLDQRVVLSAPSRINEYLLKKFIYEKSSWILQNLEKIERARMKIVKFENGEKLPFLGENLEVKIGQKNEIKDGIFYLKTGQNQENLKQIYKKLAKKVFEKRLVFWSEKTGLKYKNFYIKDNKTNWGSYSMKKNINLNWRLVLAKMEILDYVIVHELCHIKEMNHSKKFWAEVKKYDPDFKIRENWLKKNGLKLQTFLR